MEDIAIYVLALIGCLLTFACGMAFAMPDELANGCIVYEDNIYCMEVNE